MGQKSDELEKAFPELAKAGYAITSPQNKTYNCIAWAAGVNTEWWDSMPGYKWPDTATRDDNVHALVSAYAALGFEICPGGVLEFGFDKVAVYGANGLWTHAARQLPSGKWTSKLGRSEDIEHETPEAVAGTAYGSVICFMRRQSAN